MPLYFQSLRSSSAGNCLVLFSDTSAILIDCGLRTQCACRDVLGNPATPRIDGLLVSHGHSDHIGYPALKSAAAAGVPIYAHPEVIAALVYEHQFQNWRSPAPELRPYCTDPFRVGEFDVTPLAVPHAPGCVTHGFVIQHTDELGQVRKIVIATDFYRCDEEVLAHFVNADFIFIEANHDPELLRRFPNYASRFHMSNGKTARLLREARRRSDFSPTAVMLGHLSEERNTEDLALSAIREAFAKEPNGLDFALSAAPRLAPSAVTEIRLAEAGLFGRV